jgi:hypothetical protein
VSVNLTTAAPPTAVWSAQAVSSTTTYKSAVESPDGRDAFYTFEGSGDAAGDLELEANNLDDVAYEKAVIAAGSEAANTSGWVKESMLNGPGSGAFIAGTPATAVGKVAVAAANKATIRLAHGPRRRRFTYTNSSGTGTLTLRRQYFRRA